MTAHWSLGTRVQFGALLAVLAGAAPSDISAQQRPCESTGTAPGPSRDLYCIELVPAPGLEQVQARVELSYIPTPFTIAVTRDGVPRYRPVLTTSELPVPSTLGAFATYMAWAMAPDMRRTIRLGALTSERTTLREIDLEKFVVLVTAERDSTVTQPSGRIVLRAQSPSTRLQPPDVLEFALGNMVDDSLRTPPSSGAAHVHAAPSMAGGTSQKWTSHPMHPSVQMMPAEMAVMAPKR